MLILPNGKPIDEAMLQVALEDSDMENSYFLNMQTGEVIWLSDYSMSSDEREELADEIDGSHDYVRIEPISSHTAYQWMEDFVEQVVAPKNRLVAEKLSSALMGRGAFRRFRDVLDLADDKWVQAWYRWKESRLKEAMLEWFQEEFPKLE